MTPQEALHELLARLGASGGAPVLFGARGINGWPATCVACMKQHKLLVRTRPADSLVCPGCERECVMPVHVIAPQDAVARAFIVCDKRNDINRVNVRVDCLEQWQATGESIADLIATSLRLYRSLDADVQAGRWEVGVFRGAKHSSHLVLLADGKLTLRLAGHSIELIDVLELTDEGFKVEMDVLSGLVDAPVASAGDVESAVQRYTRLKERVRAMKAAGVRAFIRTLAKEEGISPSRLKQILARRPR